MNNKNVWKQITERKAEKIEVPKDFIPQYSDDFKRNMNKFFREEIGVAYDIYPEVSKTEK